MEMGDCAMSLKACRECGREVSTEATTCPHCGVKSPTSTGGLRFDRVAIFIVVILIIGYLIQGGEKSSDKTSPATSASSNQTVSSNQTNRTYPLLGETGTTNRKVFACSSKETYENFFRLVIAKDLDAMNKFAQTYALNGQCRFLEIGAQVRVEEMPVFSDNFCVRPVGDMRCVWTNTGLVQRIN
jgi:hypothetical protein